MKPILPTIRGTRSQSGFTLLELLLAITLSTVVLSAVYGAFSAGIDTQRRVMRVAGDTQAWRFFSERLRADIKNLTLVEQALSGDSKTLTLHSVLPGRPLEKIDYRYQGNAAGGQIRRHYRAADDEEQDGFASLVFDGIERFEFRYLIDGDWRDRTERTGAAADDQPKELPQAIACTVLGGGRERRLVVAIEVQDVPG